MKRACLFLLPAALLALCLPLGGCNDESKPAFTRILVTPACGVAPLQVEAYAIVSGGNEGGDPTGGNNNLDVTWDFGDGHAGTTSLAYNQFSLPGSYEVVATASDPDGNTASARYFVTVLADSLMVSALSDFPLGTVTTNDTIRFDVQAESCDIDPDSPSDYVKMIFRWEMNDAGMNIYEKKAPAFRYAAAGEYDVYLTVTYPAWAVTRRDTLHFTVTEPPVLPAR